MGTKTVNPVTPLITGADLTKVDTGGSSGTVSVRATTAQSILDFSKLIVLVENYSSTASCVVTLTVGNDYSEIGQGNAAAITVATESNVIIGGKQFESARFQDEDNYLEFSITTAATAYISAFMCH